MALYWLLTPWCAKARPPAAPLPGAEPVVLGPYFEKLVDRERRLTFEDVRSDEHESRFERNDNNAPNLGYSNAALWLRFRLPAAVSDQSEILLEVRYPPMDRIEFYAPITSQDGQILYRKATTGDTLPWTMRDVPDRNYVFRLTPHTGDFYLRATNEGNLVVPAYLWRPEAFASHSRTSQVVFGVFYGLVLALILYNLMLYLSVRDTAYLYYVLYGATFAGWLLVVDGFVFEYLGPEGGWWPNNGLAVSLSLSLFFGSQFARRFLDIASFARLADRLLQSIAWIGGVLAICGATGWLFSYRATLAIVSGLAIVLALLVVLVAVRAVLAGNRTARFFLFAWTALLAALVIYPLRNFGLIPHNTAVFHSIHAGFALDLLLLSFALGDRINRIRREAARARSEARAMDIATRHKSEFLSNMSHELRTPLNAILGFSEMLRERYFGDLTAKQAEYINDIRDAGSHLLALINDILDLSKVEAGRMELDLSDVDLQATIDSAITLIKERANRHSIAVTREIEPTLSRIRADERKVKQILLNLLSNAVKFTPDAGRIAVAARPIGAWVEISVSDTGPGIALEDQKLVFEEFKQVGKDQARKAEGTGLGLSLTKRLVQLHGGTIQVESATGMGSKFSFTLPMSSATVAKAA